MPITSYQDNRVARAIAKKLERLQDSLDRDVSFMEVCGTHTMAIYRSGLRSLLTNRIRLISGPGCPVCVSGVKYVEEALYLARQPQVVITTFGDMMRVPGNRDSLQQARAAGADVRVVYSPLDALALAKSEPDKQVVFLAVGFETTAPTIAIAVDRADRDGVSNFTALTALKTIPPAMNLLVADPELRIDGFICPGHVSVIIGAQAYESIVDDAGIPCVVAGFEPIDVLMAVHELTRMRLAGRAGLTNQYARAVRTAGNRKAQLILERMFEPCDDDWRGIGVIPESGLTLRPEFAGYDARRRWEIEAPVIDPPKGCICGEILKGVKAPGDCPLIGRRCRPESPVGACMVSSEGSCAAFYRYGIVAGSNGDRT